MQDPGLGERCVIGRASFILRKGRGSRKSLGSGGATGASSRRRAPSRAERAARTTLPAVPGGTGRPPEAAGPQARQAAASSASNLARSAAWSSPRPENSDQACTPWKKNSSHPEMIFSPAASASVRNCVSVGV